MTESLLRVTRSNVEDGEEYYSAAACYIKLRVTSTKLLHREKRSMVEEAFSKPWPGIASTTLLGSMKDIFHARGSTSTAGQRPCSTSLRLCTVCKVNERRVQEVEIYTGGTR